MLLLKYNVRLLYIPSQVYDSFHFGIKLILFAKHIGHLRLSKLVGYLLVIKMQENGYSINKDYLQYYMLPSKHVIPSFISKYCDIVSRSTQSLEKSHYLYVGLKSFYFIGSIYSINTCASLIWRE